MDKSELLLKLLKLDNEAIVEVCEFLREFVDTVEAHYLEQLQCCHLPDVEEDDPPF